MKKKKLIWKIFTPYLLIIVLSVMGMSWYASTYMKRFYFEQTRQHLETHANLLSTIIKIHFLPLDEPAIERFCRNIGKDFPVRITIVLLSGKVIGDSWIDLSQLDNHLDRPEISTAITGATGVSIRHSRSYGEKMMHLAVPVYDNQKPIFILRTSVKTTQLDSHLKTIYTQIAIAAIIIVFLSLGISLIITESITIPIKEIINGMENFGRGEFSYKLYVPNIAELDSLAESINSMASYLHDRIMTIMQQRSELETVLSSMREGLIAVDLDEKILNMNPAAIQMFQYYSQNLKGRSIQEVIRNSDLQRFVKRSLTGYAPPEEDIVFYDQGEQIFNINSSPMFDSEGSLVGTLIVLNNVTQLKNLENIRRDFAANVSHELKTPLTAIKGFVETLKRGAVNDKNESQRFLNIIENHVNRLSAIIEDLMNLSKIERMGNKGEIVLNQSSVTAVITSSVQMCTHKAEEKNITIEINCDKNIIANINPPLLEQAIINLLDNAIQYSPKDSKILACCKSTDTEVLISIQDFGIGIAEEHHARIFERFYRVDKSRSRKLGGTGLGLSIVKHIVHSHRGKITVESSPGKGSIFTISLPVIGTDVFYDHNDDHFHELRGNYYEC